MVAGDNQKCPGKDNLGHTLFWGIVLFIPVKMEASVVTALYRNTQRLLLNSTQQGAAVERDSSHRRRKK